MVAYTSTRSSVISTSCRLRSTDDSVRRSEHQSGEQRFFALYTHLLVAPCPYHPIFLDVLRRNRCNRESADNGGPASSGVLGPARGGTLQVKVFRRPAWERGPERSILGSDESRASLSLCGVCATKPHAIYRHHTDVTRRIVRV